MSEYCTECNERQIEVEMLREAVKELLEISHFAEVLPVGANNLEIQHFEKRKEENESAVINGRIAIRRSLSGLRS